MTKPRAEKRFEQLLQAMVTQPVPSENTDLMPRFSLTVWF